MSQSLRTKPARVWLAALLLLALFSVPVKAASANAQAVLDQLATLQNANIDPGWEPDIRANEGHVQTLLTLYQQCSATQRAEFTTAQNQSLRGYFEALYRVQGRAASGVDAIFAGESASGGASSSAPASSRAASSSAVSSGVSSSRAVFSSSSAASSSAALSSAPASSGAPASSAGDTSGGVSSAPAAPVSGSGGAPASSSVPVPAAVVASSSAASRSAKPVEPASVKQPANLPQIPGNEGSLAIFGNRALGNTLLLVLAALAVLVFFRFLAALRRAKKPVEDPIAPETEQPFTAFDEPPPDERDFIFTPPANLSSGGGIEPPEGAPAPRPPAAPQPPETEQSDPDWAPIRSSLPNAPVEKAPRLGNNINRHARKGRPGKMPFRQGDAEDIDGIDD